jgi:hypothetical protein
MTRNAIAARDIPEWFLEAARLMQEVDRELHNIDTQLRYGVALKDLDPVLREDMQCLLRCVDAAHLGLSVVDLTARRLLSDLAKSQSPKRGIASAA